MNATQINHAATAKMELMTEAAIAKVATMTPDAASEALRVELLVAVEIIQRAKQW